MAGIWPDQRDYRKAMLGGRQVGWGEVVYQDIQQHETKVEVGVEIRMFEWNPKQSSHWYLRYTHLANQTTVSIGSSQQTKLGDQRHHCACSRTIKKEGFEDFIHSHSGFFKEQ